MGQVRLLSHAHLPSRRRSLVIWIAVRGRALVLMCLANHPRLGETVAAAPAAPYHSRPWCRYRVYTDCLCPFREPAHASKPTPRPGAHRDVETPVAL